MTFRFVDLFAGIGGFHAALSHAGGEPVFASEIDGDAATVYRLNWAVDVRGDIIPLTAPTPVLVPEHDVLTAGFPCQAFSKSGQQRGIMEARGTLFWNILRVLEDRKPALILLENVRNLAGPRHRHTWETIVRLLRDCGYAVSDTPTVFSPHLLPPSLGGTPQVRDRVFIVGAYVGKERATELGGSETVVPYSPVQGWEPNRWNILDLLDDDGTISGIERYQLTAAETRLLSAWDDFVVALTESRGERLPGFPIWLDSLVPADSLHIPQDTPGWKATFLQKNAEFYTSNRRVIDEWFVRWDKLQDFPPSRRKFEWQAQDIGSLWDGVIHLRPSGLRVKRATYLPALVAITQTSIIGPRRRRITPREAARLQGFSDRFSFGAQPDAATYKQLGNGVAIGAAWYVLRSYVRTHTHLLPDRVAERILRAPANPISPDEEWATRLAARELVVTDAQSAKPVPVRPRQPAFAF